MATIGHALSTIKSQLAQFVTEEDVSEACREVGFAFRSRKIKPLTTIHLLLLQLLAKVSLIRLDRVAKMKVSAAAICKARMRVPVAVWMKLFERMQNRRGIAAEPRYQNHRVLLADGTTFTTEDTPQLARNYGKASNQRTTRPGYPVAKLLALADLATGTIIKVIDLPHARGEQTVLTRMLRLLDPGDLLLGDRGLVGFAQIALILQAQVHCLLRLPRTLVVKGRGVATRRRLRRLGRQDLLVRWQRPKRHALSWMSLRRWKQLPESLELRQISFRLCRPGFRTQWAWAITTFTCTEPYTAESLVELYGQRWQIETYFRDLKRSLGMQKLSAKTVHGVKKEILAFIILNNLIRWIVADAAERQGVPANRISFRDALTMLLWLAPGEEFPELRVNKRRLRPTEPRARKHAGYQFPVLRESREALRKPRALAKIGAALS